jgi:hypothetical protein
MRLKVLLVTGALVAIQAVSYAQHNTFFNRPPSPKEAEIGFGIFPPAGPIDDSPLCLTPSTGIVGGPFDPCAYKIHKLVPEETTIRWGGEVTFHVHGGGHAIAIYNVSRRTTRQDIGAILCEHSSIDPGTIEDPLNHPCLGTTPAGQANAARNITIKDASRDVVIVTGAGGPTHPNNRIWYSPGRLMAAGGNHFLTGVGPGPPPVTPTTGQLLTYRFLVPGRYLVICGNRSHFMNDWMFGFVNVELF